MNKPNKPASVIRVISAIILMFPLLFLISCREDEADNIPENIQPEYYIIQSNSDGPRSGGHFRKEYSGTFTADTDLPDRIPDSIDILYAKAAVFGEQQLIDVFFKDRDIQKETNNNTDNIYYRASDGSCLDIQQQTHSVLYRSRTDMLTKLPTENFGTKLQAIMFPSSYIPCFDTVYKQKELTSLSQEDAVAKAGELLDRLNISVSDDIEIYAVDHKTMQKYQDETLAGSGNISDNYELIYSYSDEHEFYVIGYTVTAGGLPLSHRRYYYSSADMFVDGAYAEIRIGKDGIVRFEADGIYLPYGTKETIGDIISPERAIEKVYEITASYNTGEPAVAEAIDLGYTVVPYNTDDGIFLMVPSWDITLRYDWDEGGYTYQVYSINARTGEQMT